MNFWRFAATGLAILSFTTQVAAASFYDTDATPYADAFSYLAANNIIHGYPDGSGRPYAALNRVEALKVIMDSDPVSVARVEYYQRHLPALPLFRDVDQSAWYAPYVEAAFAEGLIAGYPDRTFRPASQMTTEEAVSMLMRWNDHGRVTLAAATITGQGADVWYSGYVQEAAQHNLYPSDGPLYIHEPVTRGQFFEMIYRLAQWKKSGGEAYQGPQGQTPTLRPVAVLPQQSYTNTVTTYQPTNSYAQVPRPSPLPAPVTTVQQGTTAAAFQPTQSTYFAISLPSIGINDLKVSDPLDPFSSQGILEPLKLGVGHLFAYPGTNGKVMIYGHSSGYAWDISKFTKIFRGINKLNVGDRVYLNYHGTVYTYQVSFKEAVPSGDTSRFVGTGEELILYTCWPPDSIKQRYLVHALPVN